MQRFSLALLAFTIAFATLAHAQSIQLNSSGGDAWTFRKRIEGTVAGACDEIVVSGPAGSTVATQFGSRFVAELPLREGANDVRARCRRHSREVSRSAPQHWTVRLQDGPKAWPRIVETHAGLVLDSGASSTGQARPAPIVSARWRVEPVTDPVEGRRVPLPMPADGSHRVTLTVTDALGRSDTAVARMVIEDGRLAATDEYPRWAANAIVYGAVPFLFGPRGLADVTARLDAIAALGATAIWLSPLTAGPAGDFGYAVTDHFALRASFGAPEELQQLVAAAHARGLRVILDFVPNHLSDRHPYYRDAARRGAVSAYAGFFDRDGAGVVTSYFDWSNLKNLNFDNAEVQAYVIEAFLHWVRAFDIDGFRVDASWGIRERAPEFWPRWRAELKRVKPDLLLLAEASARDPYYLAHGFDATYDWTGKLGEWAWQAAFDGKNDVAANLRAALAAAIDTGQPDRVLRFLENNDTGARFVTRHGAPATRVAAAMLMTLPGIPLIYAGQEIGAAYEPYGPRHPIDWSADPDGLRGFYTRLIALRAASPALRGADLRLLDSGPSFLAYLRPGRTSDEDAVVVLNFSAAPAKVSFAEEQAADVVRHGMVTDLMTGETVVPVGAPIELHGFGALLLRKSHYDTQEQAAGD
jgi:cyclomaltodextrinase